MANLAQIIGNRLRAARERAGLTQMALSAAAGIPQTTLSGWERGKQSELLSGLEVLMSALGADPAELVSSEPESHEEAEIVRLYRLCDPTTREIVSGILTARAEQERPRANG